MMNLDLHVHTDASYDCNTTPEQIVEHAQKKDFLDGFAVTDHDSVKNHGEIRQLTKDTDLVFIPGIEISTKDGHLIALNVEEEIPSQKPVEQTIKQVRQQNGIAIVPHPFQIMRKGIKKRKLDKIDVDAIEVFNSRLITGYRNLQSERYADKNDIPKVSGSDAHVPELVGTTYTQIKTESNETKDIIEAIKKGGCGIHKKKTPTKEFIQQVIANNMRTRLGSPVKRLFSR